MGLSLFSSSSYDYQPKVINKNIVKYLPNPNPKNFTIKRFRQIGKYLITEINYHDSTNYEGNKILVFENYNIEKLKKRKSIDPHFSDNKKFKSPIARFEPTNKGWELAIKLCK